MCCVLSHCSDLFRPLFISPHPLSFPLSHSSWDLEKRSIQLLKNQKPRLWEAMGVTALFSRHDWILDEGEKRKGWLFFNFHPPRPHLYSPSSSLPPCQKQLQNIMTRKLILSPSWLQAYTCVTRILNHIQFPEGHPSVD